MYRKNHFSQATAIIVFLLLNIAVQSQTTHSKAHSVQKLGLGFNLGISSKIQDRSAVLGILNIEYNVLSNVSVSISTGYFSYNQLGFTSSEYVSGQDNQLILLSEEKTGDYFRHAIPIIAGLKYFTPILGGIQPFLSAEWGYYILLNRDSNSSTPYRTIYDNEGNIKAQTMRTQDKQGNALGLGIGVLYPVNSNNIVFHVQRITSNFTGSHVRINLGYIVNI